MKKVEFKDLYTVPEVVGCVGCIFENARLPNCGEILQILTGKDCAFSDIVFKRKPKYTKCTRENTQAGDEVLFEGREYRVDVIYDNDDVVLTYIGDNSNHSIRMIGDCYREVSSVYGR